MCIFVIFAENQATVSISAPSILAGLHVCSASILLFAPMAL